MFDSFTPVNWFWVLMGILLCCYIKLQSMNHNYLAAPSFSPASIVALIGF